MHNACFHARHHILCYTSFACCHASITSSKIGQQSVVSAGGLVIGCLKAVNLQCKLHLLVDCSNESPLGFGDLLCESRDDSMDEMVQ